MKLVFAGVAAVLVFAFAAPAQAALPAAPAVPQTPAVQQTAQQAASQAVGAVQQQAEQPVSQVAETVPQAKPVEQAVKSVDQTVKTTVDNTVRKVAPARPPAAPPTSHPRATPPSPRTDGQPPSVDRQPRGRVLGVVHRHRPPPHGPLAAKRVNDLQSASARPPAAEVGGRPVSSPPRTAPAPAAGGATALPFSSSYSGGGFSVPFLALLVLAALVVPRLMRRLDGLPAFVRPEPFLCALERPG